MKKILSLALAGVMMFSALPVAYATTTYENPTEDTEMGTAVAYNADTVDADGDGNPDNVEAYTITVPAQLAPGGSGNVVVAGTWNSARKLVVSAPTTVTLENDIDTSNTKTLNVTFEGYDLAGSNTAAMSGSKAIVVEDWGDEAQNNVTAPLFGNWTGIITYEAGIVNVA